MDPGPKVRNPNLVVLDDDRDPEMLATGLSLADTANLKKQTIDKPSKRRTLDDMRRLSEHIKKKARVYRRK